MGRCLKPHSNALEIGANLRESPLMFFPLCEHWPLGYLTVSVTFFHVCPRRVQGQLCGDLPDPGEIRDSGGPTCANGWKSLWISWIT
eukprot:1362248-Amorphochlora_amoeboformis.AAC.3